MNDVIKPLLAAKLDFGRLRYPVYVSPKIDGLRCIIRNGRPMSRTWKQLPNQAFRNAVRKYAEQLELLDGEVVVGKPTAPNVYNATMSGIMCQTGLPNFTYLVFDDLTAMTKPYAERWAKLKQRELPSWCARLPQYICNDQKQLEKIEQACQDIGFEGVIVRSPFAPYKQGRSTVPQGYLLKLKRYEDTEAVVVGSQELLHNDNPAFIDAQGHTKHTSHKAGQRPGGVLGALVCKTPDGITFNIGTGFDYALRQTLWTRRAELVGRIVKYKHLPHGRLDAPRHPVFLGWRDPIDM